jgi:hypothetical protein
VTAHDKTIDLIKKLLAKAESAAQIGSTEEAASFAAKANELLLKHKLEMSDIQVAAQDTDDAVTREVYDPSDAMRWVGKGRRVAWLEALTSGVARANFCKILIFTGSKQVTIIGRPSDVAITKYLLSVLVREAERLAVLYEREVRVAAERRGDPTPVQPKRGFLLGFTNAVLERLRAMRKQTETAGGKHALVRFQAADLAVQKYIEQTYKGLRSVGRPDSNTANKSAWEAGRKAGQSVNLNSGIGGGATGKGQSTLGKGHNLLGGGK